MAFIALRKERVGEIEKKRSMFASPPFPHLGMVYFFSFPFLFPCVLTSFYDRLIRDGTLFCFFVLFLFFSFVHKAFCALHNASPMDTFAAGTARTGDRRLLLLFPTRRVDDDTALLFDILGRWW